MTDQITLYFKKLSDTAKVPVYGSAFAAGLDAHSDIECTILPGERRPIPIGVSVSWEGLDSENYYMRVAARSGLASKLGIDVSAGVIDFDYRGQVHALLVNNGKTEFEIKHGDRIAQLILEKINRPNIRIVDEHPVAETDRGHGGFGSTGV